jgi:hypothetical protein
MNTAPAQVHAVLRGKEAFSRFKVHGFMEPIKTIISQAEQKLTFHSFNIRR